MKIAPSGAIERRRQQRLNFAIEGSSLNLKSPDSVYLPLLVLDAAYSGSQRTGQDLQFFQSEFDGLSGAIESVDSDTFRFVEMNAKTCAELGQGYCN